MAEYIERDSAAAFAYECGAVYVSNRLSHKNAFPSADVAPVVHGRWIYIRKYGEYECSVCHGIDTDCSDYYSSHVVTEQNYCPNCGAKMDEVE